MFGLKTLRFMIRLLMVGLFIGIIIFLFSGILGDTIKEGCNGVSIIIRIAIYILIFGGLGTLQDKLKISISNRKIAKQSKSNINKHQLPNQQYNPTIHKEVKMVNQSFIDAAKKLELPNNVSMAQEFISQKKYIDAMKCYEKEEIKVRKLCSSERNGRLIMLYDKMATLCKLVGDKIGEGKYLKKNHDIKNQIEKDELESKLNIYQKQIEQINTNLRGGKKGEALSQIYESMADIYLQLRDDYHHKEYMKKSRQAIPWFGSSYRPDDKPD